MATLPLLTYCNNNKQSGKALNQLPADTDQGECSANENTGGGCTQHRTFVIINMMNSLKGMMAMSKAKSFVSDAGIKIPGDDDEKGDAKIAAKVAKHKAGIEKNKAESEDKQQQLHERMQARKARKAKLEKAGGYR